MVKAPNPYATRHLQVERGYLFVAGSPKMATDVRRAVERALGAAGGLSERDAATALRVLERDRRYCVEAWS